LRINPVLFAEGDGVSELCPHGPFGLGLIPCGACCLIGNFQSLLGRVTLPFLKFLRGLDNGVLKGGLLYLNGRLLCARLSQPVALL
jgi:hypothetical protein